MVKLAAVHAQRQRAAFYNVSVPDRFNHCLHLFRAASPLTAQLLPWGCRVVDVLGRLKVMERNADGTYNITADGYSFLLHDMPTQLWLFVRQYIESASERGYTVAAFTKQDPRWTRGCVELEEGKAVQLMDRATSTDASGQWWKVKYPGVTEEMPMVGKVPAECIEQQSAAEMLIFLFQLSFVQLGQAVAVDQLSP